MRFNKFDKFMDDPQSIAIIEEALEDARNESLQRIIDFSKRLDEKTNVLSMEIYRRKHAKK